MSDKGNPLDRLTRPGGRSLSDDESIPVLTERLTLPSLDLDISLPKAPPAVTAPPVAAPPPPPPPPPATTAATAATSTTAASRCDCGRTGGAEGTRSRHAGAGDRPIDASGRGRAEPDLRIGDPQRARSAGGLDAPRAVAARCRVARVAAGTDRRSCAPDARTAAAGDGSCTQCADVRAAPGVRIASARGRRAGRRGGNRPTARARLTPPRLPAGGTRKILVSASTAGPPASQ